jgi:hypothetical protein
MGKHNLKHIVSVNKNVYGDRWVNGNGYTIAVRCELEHHGVIVVIISGKLSSDASTMMDDFLSDF